MAPRHPISPGNPNNNNLWNLITGNAPTSKGKKKNNAVEALIASGGNGNLQDLKDLVAAKKASSAAVSVSQPTQEISPLEQMLAQFGGGFSVPSQADLSKQAQDLSVAEFAPKIAALQAEMNRAKQSGARARKDVGALYDQLVGEYTQEEKRNRKTYKNEKSTNRTRTSNLRNTITDDYTQLIKDRVNEYKALGIESAAPSSLDGVYGDQASQLAQAASEGAIEDYALGQEERASGNFLRDSRLASRQEGAEAQSDVIRQLQDYLNKSGTSLADLQGQQNSMFQQTLAKLTENAASAQTQYQENLWDKLLEYGKFSQDQSNDTFSRDMRLKEFQQKYGNGGSSAALGTGLQGAAGYLGDQDLVNFFQGALDAGQKYAGTEQGKAAYGTGFKPANSPEQMASIIRNHAINQGKSPAEAMKLFQAALIYYGRGS